MIKIFSILTVYLIVVLVASSAYCQPTINGTSTGLVLLCLSAHPDDEDGATLAYYAKLKGVKTYSVFYTRGEGGQNEIGSELGNDLGILRAKETQSAATLLGSEIFFLGFPDFGFSKTAKETFVQWAGSDHVLARSVYFIRALKPDIIITNHDTVTTKPNRQHGNHQVVGITVYDAFEKAADRSFHPEQFNDSIGPWQVKKLFYRISVRDTSISINRLVELDMTQRDSSGVQIKEISLSALRKHRSQGMATLILADRPNVSRYLIARSDRQYRFDQHDLFSGITPSRRTAASVNSLPTDSLPVNGNSPHQAISAVRAPNIHIGLLKTYDMTIEETMKSFKIDYSLIDSAQLASGQLEKFTTIILDLRAYLYRTDAAHYNNRLLDYAKNGGNLVCFYHKPADWNGKNFAPFQITLTGERVTEENTSVMLRHSAHPVFNYPNHITANDWNGWVQERNIYLPSDDTIKTSSRYERLLAMSDEGESQPSTSLLWCRYGKGTYSYVSLALYRQLRILHEGALKLFFNLISQEKGS